MFLWKFLRASPYTFSFIHSCTTTTITTTIHTAEQRSTLSWRYRYVKECTASESAVLANFCKTFTNITTTTTAAAAAAAAAATTTTTTTATTTTTTTTCKI